MYQLTPFILQNFLKQWSEPIQSYADVPFSGLQLPICPERFFLVKIIITFMYLQALFIVQNLKKILTSDPELWCNILGQKMVYLPQTKTFLEKMINIIFIYLLAPFIVQNF